MSLWTRFLSLFRKEQSAEELTDLQEKANALIEIEKFKRDQLLLNDQLTEDERNLIKEESLARQIEIQEEAYNEINKLREKETKEIALEEKKRENIKKQNLQNGLDLTQAAVGLASEILGRETKAGKALAITASGINTAQAVTRTLATYGGTPIGYAQAAAVGATGAVQIAKMKSTDVSGGSGGGSVADISAPSIDSSTTQPNTSIVDNQISQQEALISALESQNYVVSVSEINDVQNSVSVGETESTI